MDAHEYTPRIQVLSVSDTGRRRRWTDAEKVRIIEESHLCGSAIAEVARRYRHRLGRFLQMKRGAGRRGIRAVAGQPRTYAPG
jgi:transposase